jgi:hypothetical protein
VIHSTLLACICCCSGTEAGSGQRLRTPTETGINRISRKVIPHISVFSLNAISCLCAWSSLPAVILGATLGGFLLIASITCVALVRVNSDKSVVTCSNSISRNNVPGSGSIKWGVSVPSQGIVKLRKVFRAVSVFIWSIRFCVASASSGIAGCHVLGGITGPWLI